jgi:hypothetical protein
LTSLATTRTCMLRDVADVDGIVTGRTSSSS